MKLEWRDLKDAPRDGKTQLLVDFPHERGGSTIDVVHWSERHQMWASHDGGWGCERYRADWPDALYIEVPRPERLELEAAPLVAPLPWSIAENQ